MTHTSNRTLQVGLHTRCGLPNTGYGYLLRNEQAFLNLITILIS